MRRALAPGLVMLAGYVLTTSSGAAAVQSRTGAEPLTIHLVAVTSDGQPIRNLRPEDLMVKVDGSVRPVKALQLTVLGQSRSASPIRVLPPPFETNVLERGTRSLMIAIDAGSLGVGDDRRTRQAVEQLLTELGPADRVALSTVPRGALDVDFTTDRERVRRALARLAAQPKSSLSTSAATEAPCQSRAVLEQVAGTLESLRGSPPPTVLVLMTAGLTGSKSAGARGQQMAGQCELSAANFQSVGRALADVEATLYLVQVERADSIGVSGIGLGTGEAGLDELSAATGADILRLGDSGGALGRIARETAVYYEARVDLEPAGRNGGAHRIEVKAARSDATIRTRPSVATTGVAGPAIRLSARTARETLRDRQTYGAFPIRATSFISRRTGDPAGRLMVVALIEAVDPAVKPSAVAAALYDAAGKSVAEWVARPDELMSGPVRAGMLAASGTYRLRVAASDAAGRLGVVDSDIMATLTPAGPLTLSSMVLGTSGGTDFAPKLEFAPGDRTVTAFFELYGGRSNMQLVAAVELAERPDGPALASAQPRWAATSEPDRFTAMGQLPIESLSPGDYVVRAIIAAEGQPEGRLIRTIRKR